MERSARRSAADERTVRWVLGALAVYHLLLGLMLVVAPGEFYERIGPFGERNDHYLRDVSTFYLAFAAGLAVAVNRRSWRVPVVALIAVQYGLHTINHVVDIGEADPGWVGPFDAVSLALLTALLVWLWRVEERRE